MQAALRTSTSEGALCLADSDGDLLSGLTGSSKSALAELAAEKVADSPKWAPRPTRRFRPSQSWQSSFLDYREERQLSASSATTWEISESDTQSVTSTSQGLEDCNRTSESSDTLSQATCGSVRGRESSRGGEREKHSRESFETPSLDSESYAQGGARHTHGRGFGALRAEFGHTHSPRQSFDTTADFLSDLDQFDAEDSSWRPGAAISGSFSLQMGISQRKSYLNNLSEQRDAKEAETLGWSAPSGMPLPDSNASFAARRCMSWADTTTPVQDSSQELGPDDSDNEESEDKQDQCAKSQSQRAVSAKSLPRSISGSYPSEGGTAAAELFLRLNHARQTVSFVKKQAASYSKLDRVQMDVWEALDMLGELREYESALYDAPETDPWMSLVDHAYQTAEACRLAYPTHDWLHLVGLIHSLGKLLGHSRLAVEPQWAICGEAFPVGCRFDPAIAFSHFFGANPDRRSRTFNTPTGLYRQGGGLASVYMAWSYSEYLYMLLLLNKTQLPPEALFIIRYQKFFSLDSSPAYQSLMGPSDKAMQPWLATFRRLSAYKKADLPGALTGSEFKTYYSALLRKYIPAGTLRF